MRVVLFFRAEVGGKSLSLARKTRLIMDEQEKELLVQAVCEIVCMIPQGRATSYGAIARAAGYPNLSRMVGRIMGGHLPAHVPAHRVVNSSGVLSGSAAFGPANEMGELLEAEGVSIRNNRIVGWKRVFWDPLVEI